MATLATMQRADFVGAANRHQSVKGKVYAVLPKTKPEQAWALPRDFCNLKRIMPSLNICVKIEGQNDVVCCVRFVEGVMHPSEQQFWAKEKLVALDDKTTSYSYVFVGSSIKVVDYSATMQIVKGDDSGRGGCRFEWSFQYKDLYGVTRAQFTETLQLWAIEIAAKIEEICHSGK